MLAGLYLCVSITGCQSGDEIVSLEQRNPDDFLVLFSDTSTVTLSTLAMDSVMTGSGDRMLIGRYNDPYFGKMQAAAFFQPVLRAAVSLPEKAVYDSLVLKMAYFNKLENLHNQYYFYGDTTKTLNLTAHALQQDMLLKNGAYYAYNQTPYDKEPIGKISFKPSPHATKSVRIKLSDVLGKKIFDQSAANLLTTNDQWIELVKGLTVMSDAKDNGAIVGFMSFSDSTAVELHYHTEEKDGVTKGVAAFTSNAEYNYIQGDRTGTDLAKLQFNSRASLPTSQTGEKAFIQPGVGIMMRADFPTLRGLKDVKYSVPNRAFLRITPIQESITEQLKAPKTIHVFYCDKNNQFLRSSSAGAPIPLTDLAGKLVTGSYINDMVNNKQYYLFDVSSQFTSILSSPSSDANGLLFVPSELTSGEFIVKDTEFAKSLTRLVIGSQKHPTSPGVKLELYYTTLKP